MSEGGGVTVRWCKSQIVSNEEKVGILGILVIYALPAAGWAGVNSPDTDIDMTKDTFIIVLVLLSQMLLLFNINIIISSSSHWLNKISITKNLNCPSRGLLRDCTTSPINRYVALIISCHIVLPHPPPPIQLMTS